MKKQELQKEMKKETPSDQWRIVSQKFTTWVINTSDNFETRIWRSTSRWTTSTFKILLQQKYKFTQWLSQLTLSWRCLSCRNHSIDLFYKSLDWFLYDKHLIHGRVKHYRDGIKRCILERLFLTCWTSH